MLDTRWELYGMLCQASVGVASALVALTADNVDLAGFIYLSLFVIIWIHGSLQGRRRRELKARLVTAET
jgi:hypothetical protein